MLVHASGLRVQRDAPRDLARLQQLGRRLGALASDSEPLPGMPGIDIARAPHAGSLRELAKIFRVSESGRTGGLEKRSSAVHSC